MKLREALNKVINKVDKNIGLKEFPYITENVSACPPSPNGSERGWRPWVKSAGGSRRCSSRSSSDGSYVDSKNWGAWIK